MTLEYTTFDLILIAILHELIILYVYSKSNEWKFLEEIDLGRNSPMWGIMFVPFLGTTAYIMTFILIFSFFAPFVIPLLIFNGVRKIIFKEDIKWLS